MALSVTRHASARRRPGRRPKPGNQIRKAALVAMPLIVGVAGWFVMNDYINTERADANYCYARPDQHTAAVFVDNSLTHLSGAQLRDYRTGFTQAYNRLPPNARISIFTTAANVQNSLGLPVFSICKPANTPAEQAAIGAPEETGPRLTVIAGEARAAYDAAVEEAIAAAQNPSLNAGDSPILEQLRSISRSDYFQGATRSLTAITDGIQNSEIARFCVVQGAMPSYGRFAARSDMDQIAPQPFTGTDVTVLLVESLQLPQPNLPYCNNAELRTWWKAYFNQNGARDAGVDPLRYWGGP